MVSQSNNRYGGHETQGEPSYASRTPCDKKAKLLDDAQRTAKATFKWRPGRLLLEGRDSRDITIKHLQAQLTEMTQILADNKLMKPIQKIIGGPRESLKA